MVMMRWRRGNMCLHELRGSVVDWSMNSDEYRATGLELGYEYGDGYESEMFCCLSLTTRLPMTTVARKKGTQTFEATHLDTNKFYADISTFFKILCKYNLCKSLNCFVKKDPHAIPHRLDPLPTEDTEHDHEAVHEVGEVPARHHLLREPLHIVWNTFELSADFPPGRESPLCDQKFIHSQPV